MFKSKRFKALENECIKLKDAFESEKEKVLQREKLIDGFQKREKELKKEKEMYQSKVVIAETKLSKIKNAINSNKENSEKAFNEICSIVLVSKGKHFN